MKVRKIGKTIGLTAFVFALWAVSLSGISSSVAKNTILPSLEWQKITLQEKIHQKVVESLSTVLKPKQYVADVEVLISPPKKPNFAQNKKDESKKHQVRPSDVNVNKAPKDALIFSKFGLEAPLVEDFTAPKNRKSQVEEMWDYNQSIDVFKNLDNITIYVSLSDQLGEETRNTVETMINGLKFNFADIKPEVKFEYIDLEGSLAPGAGSTSLDEVLNWCAKFSDTIGLILASLLLGLIGYMLLRKYEQIKKRETPAQMASASSDFNDDEDELSEDPAAAVAELNDKEAGQYNGIDRFRAFLKHSPTEAHILIKKWIKAADQDSINALRALVQQLDNDELGIVFDMISIDDRTEWRSYLSDILTRDELKKANTFISNQIVEDIIVPPVFLDAEICDLLLSLSSEKAALFIKENGELGKILMNVMSTKFVSRILDHLGPDEADQAVQDSLTFVTEDAQNSLDDFKATLQSYQEKKEKLPFMERISDLISMVNPAKERSLFSALASAGDEGKLKELALEFFPAELIIDLPEPLLKIMITKYPMNKKIELIGSIDEDLKDKFIDIYAPPGSVAKDMLDLEMEKIDTDVQLQKRVRDEKDDIWKEFVSFVRKMTKSEKIYAEEVEEIVDRWASDVSDRAPTLSLVEKDVA